MRRIYWTAAAVAVVVALYGGLRSVQPAQLPPVTTACRWPEEVEMVHALFPPPQAADGLEALLARGRAELLRSPVPTPREQLAHDAGTLTEVLYRDFGPSAHMITLDAGPLPYTAGREWGATIAMPGLFPVRLVYLRSVGRDWWDLGAHRFGGDHFAYRVDFPPGDRPAEYFRRLDVALAFAEREFAAEADRQRLPVGPPLNLTPTVPAHQEGRPGWPPAPAIPDGPAGDGSGAARVRIAGDDRPF